MDPDGRIVMKAFIPAVLLVLFAQPSHAFDRMVRSECQEIFTRAAALNPVPEADQDARIADIAQSFQVTLDGWCQFETGDSVEEAGFEVICGI